jgi:O-antigen/teichoic acid export membrane protein
MSLSGFATWNLAGQALPLAVALFSYPLLLHFAGLERVGAMSLAWALVGYLGLLDLGLGRVVTRRIAVGRARAALEHETPLVRAMFLAIGSIAIVFTAALWITSDRWLARIGLTAAILDEAHRAVPWLMLAILPTALGAFLSGVLEGLESFGRTNVVRIASSLWGYLAPVAVALVEPSLVPMIAAVAIGRWLALIALAQAVVQALPRSSATAAAAVGAVGPSLREGAWIAVSNVVGPLMTVFDRFVLAYIAGAAILPYYTVSYDFISKTLVIPGALLASIYPTLARAAESAESRAAADRAATRTWGWIAATLGPLCIGVGAAAHALLATWLGPAFGLQAQETLRWLALGMFLNGLAYLPFGVLQAAQRARTTAMVHVVELPFYLALLWIGTAAYGPAGAAMAWTVRAGVDLVVMASCSDLMRRTSRKALVWIGAMLALCVATVAFGLLFAPDRAVDLIVLCVVGSLGLVIADRTLHATSGGGAFENLQRIARALAPSRGKPLR